LVVWCAVVLGVGALLTSGRPARACASCSCGAPAPLPIGAEVPFAGRLRLGTSLGTASVRADDGRALWRAELGLDAAWAVSERVVLEGRLPLAGVWRQAPTPALADDAKGPAAATAGSARVDGFAVGVGQPQLGVRLGLYRDRAFMPRLLWDLRLGLVLPGPLPAHTARGALLAPELQPGRAEWAGRAGTQLTWLPRDSVAVVASLLGQGPLLAAAAAMPALVEARGLVQWSATPAVAVRGGVGARATGAEEVAGARLGARGSGFVVAGALWRPPAVGDAVAFVDVAVPVVSVVEAGAAAAVHDGPQLGLGVIWDLAG
jgi:hypothetical protein